MSPKIPRHPRIPLVRIDEPRSRCFEIVDSSSHYFSAAQFLQGAASRDSVPQAARLSQQFLSQNRGILSNFGISGDLQYDGSNLQIVFRAGTRIGAFPLLSPTTGKPDFGMVIRPRFDWTGIGPMLAAMGWRIVPTLLRLPLLPKSERRIPSWVLSSMILVRLKSLLERLDRRFEIIESVLPAPRGTVNWNRYASRSVSSGKFLEVPCRFPDLRDDRQLNPRFISVSSDIYQALKVNEPQESLWFN